MAIADDSQEQKQKLIGKVDGKRDLKTAVEELMETQVVQCLDVMLNAVIF